MIEQCRFKPGNRERRRNLRSRFWLWRAKIQTKSDGFPPSNILINISARSGPCKCGHIYLISYWVIVTVSQFLLHQQCSTSTVLLFLGRIGKYYNVARLVSCGSPSSWSTRDCQWPIGDPEQSYSNRWGFILWPNPYTWCVPIHATISGLSPVR